METLSNESTLTVYKCLDTDLSKSRPFWGQRLDKCYVCFLEVPVGAQLSEKSYFRTVT